MYGPILAQSSICHDFIRRIVAYIPILHPERNFALPDTTFSRNSQFINLIGRCIAIEFAASLDSEGASATNMHFHSFSQAYPCARPLPPYNFSEKTENGRKNKNDSSMAKKKRRKKNHWTSRDSSEPARPAIFTVLTFSPETLLARFSKDSPRRNITCEDVLRKRIFFRNLMISQ